MTLWRVGAVLLLWCTEFLVEAVNTQTRGKKHDVQAGGAKGACWREQLGECKKCNTKITPVTLYFVLV